MSTAITTISQAQKAILSGEITPTKLVESTLTAINTTDAVLQANITVCKEEALLRAKTLESLIGTPEGKNMPLLGIPLSVKDVFCTKGIATTAASKMLANFTPPYSAHIVEQLEKAGAIIVAKTNMDEFAMGASTEFSSHAKTTNPWDTTRVPGGSSGGAAASVASGQVLASIGTDSGGSIRQPAALCGCVGLKPTYGRVSRYGTIAYASSFDQAGPMASCVEDCGILYDIIAGYDPKDPTASLHPVTPFAQTPPLADLSGVTIGLIKELWDLDLSSEVRKACEDAVASAKNAGAKIVELSLTHLPYSVASYYILTTAEASTNMARYDGVRFGLRAGSEDDDLIAMYTKSRTEGFGEEVKRRILLGTYVLSSGYYDSYYKKAAQVRRLVHDDFVTAFSSCDILMAPSTSRTAWQFGTFADNPLEAYKMDILTLGANLAGIPGLNLPVGLGEESKLPVGIQLLGNHFAETQLLRIAQVLEKVLPPLGKPEL